MAMSAEHKPEFAAFHRQWLRLHMSEEFSGGMKNPKQTKEKNKQTHKYRQKVYSIISVHMHEQEERDSNI